MNRKKFEDSFSIDMENYINEKEKIKTDDEEYRDLLELGEELSNKDFSENGHKTEIFEKTLVNIKKSKGVDNVKKSNKTIIKVASFALICILGISGMRTSFAQELVDKIVSFISISHVTVYEEPIYNEGDIIQVPEELKGKIFDQEGNPILEFAAGIPKTLYTSDGEEIDRIATDTLKIITVAEAKKEDNLIVSDTKRLNDYTCFEVILPTYLPKGYEFDRAEFFKDENGVVENSKYISLFFKNMGTKEYIYMQQRFADKETAYEAGGKKIEQLSINGADAILYDNNLDWEDNGVIYALSGRGISREELIKVAESFK